MLSICNHMYIVNFMLKDTLISHTVFMWRTHCTGGLVRVGERYAGQLHLKQSLVTPSQLERSTHCATEILLIPRSNPKYLAS